MTSNRRMRTVLFVTNLTHTPQGIFKYEGEQYRQFREAYMDLSVLLQQRNVQLYFTDIDHLRDDGTFSEMFQIEGHDDDRLVLSAVATGLPGIVVNRVKDILYSHAGYAKLSENVPIVNEESIARLGNKAESLQVLGDFLPQSTIIDGLNESERRAAFEKALHQWGSVVVKPLRENGGRAVVLAHDIDQLAEVISESQPYIAQEFIETGEGVEGLVVGRHDVRLYIIAGEVVAASIRQPKEGGFLSNTSQGGGIAFLELTALPEDLLHTAQRIIRQLALPRFSFISLDFFFGNDRWYLIEANDQPGIPATYQHKRVAATIHKALTAMYTEAIES